MTNLANKQRGVFSIELAMILVGFSLIIVFTMDVVTKQSVKGKLDRLSYSVVSLLKERTQLFDGEERMTNGEAAAALALVSNSLTATMNSFEASRVGILIEQQRFNSEQQAIPSVNGVNIYKVGEYDCEPVARLSTKAELSPVTNFGNRLSLYQVTLCYQTDNLFGSLIGKSWELARSTSISIGR
ncbi:pilus assembly protein TadF [Enterovibrio sp. ZSDZ35]|uniref:Pilus assembly protein TadF n=1 Tax=Enterovibrio qingdaonensis TaxID=2899818 RepID=A0ABT5QL82_9GAMM|nr:tight adherence pilus pseudopilin TadF [Enterovibrio sp. ZSDZ35]MDD1781723.1 pilus assembly protein TadF [Enterovibrio sp. ZSDZ35]